ncbi:MAG: ABC transporter permease [bacterium]
MLNDLRYAVRSLRRSPAYTIVVVLTLGLGIGANTTAFSWMEGLVLNPFPLVREPSRLVTVKAKTSRGTADNFSYPAFAALMARTRTVDGLAAYQLNQFGLQTHADGGQAEPVFGVFATSNYFSVLGVKPALGRAFLPSDSVAGAGPVVVLGHSLWRHHFAADSAVIGRRIRLNGHEATVVGVAPPGFVGSFAALRFDLWVPVSSYDLLAGGPGALMSTHTWWLVTFGRLRPGSSMDQARVELDLVGQQVARDNPDLGIMSAAVEPFEGGNARRILAPTFTALLGVTALVMLIVCANLANLFLARASGRQREFAVRAAIGAGRGRIARQLLVECLALAAPGALLGIGLAAWGRDALAAIVPTTGSPVVLDTPLDLRVLAFAIALTLLAVLLFGLAPALRASRLDLTSRLKSGSPGSGTSRSRLRGAFVVVQIALSLVTVVSAALFVRTVRALERIDPGFRDGEHVLLVSTNFGFAGVRDGAQMRTTVDRLIDGVAGIPGVAAVAAADFVPMGLNCDQCGNWRVSVPGYSPRRDERMTADITHITPSYFSVMRIPIVRGRTMSQVDPARPSMRAIVVNETFAKRYFVGRDPIGAGVALGFAPEPNAVIVGVAHNVISALANVTEMSGAADPMFYLSYASDPQTSVTLHIRTAGDPFSVLSEVRRTFARVAPALAVVAPETLDEHASGAFALQRLGASVLGVLGAVALLLAALGLYGVTSYAVTQRTHEVGVRVALGASARQVLTLFLSDGFRLAAIGVVTGWIIALAMGRLLASQLYGVAPSDPATLAGTALLLSLVTLVANYVPARRATRVSPLIALRAD